MFIGNSVWIANDSDFKELVDMFTGGTRLASGLEYSHECKDGDNLYYCFAPTDKRVTGAFYVTADYLTRALDLVSVTVKLGKDCPVVFTPHDIAGMDMFDRVYTYFTYRQDKRRKTSCFTMLQYRAASPYYPLYEILTQGYKNSPYYAAMGKWHTVY